ncbi:hypothetical protein HPB50_022468 [Hyalomma asiaticum]|uniref:Uncharacterized protein n=1 Tax=Hyalomma asiaticum TaxID=266040 RepID=A0ACB7TMK4_HYAAI|nr:hypothetical protein HPB50_022468 [Hyalomma asiaticum]
MDASQLTKRKRSRNQNLPPLPLRDEKIILRPQARLCLDKWTRPELADALWSAAGLSNEGRQDIIFRLRPQHNFAIISTPHSHASDALYKVRELSLGQQVYPITTYFAAPDNSCKGIVPGIVPDLSCPKCARQTLNKAWVRKAIKKEEHRELQPSNKQTTPTGATDAGNSRAPTTVTGVRSKTRPRSRGKYRTRSESQSRYREASTRLPEKRPPGHPSPSLQQPYKKALQTSASAKVTQTPSEMQRNPAQKTATEAPRERTRARKGSLSTASTVSTQLTLRAKGPSVSRLPSLKGAHWRTRLQENIRRTPSAPESLSNRVKNFSPAGCTTTRSSPPYDPCFSNSLSHLSTKRMRAVVSPNYTIARNVASTFSTAHETRVE